MTTALEVGLVPGFALQDGDQIAKLLGGAGGGAGGGGGLGLGNTVSSGVSLVGSSDNNIIGATQVSSSVTVVTTVTATGNSIQLAVIGMASALRIYNESANIMYVFPPTGQSIDGAPVNAAVFLSGGARCEYVYLGANAWISDLLGSPSA
jgi:hypothetical protein